MDEEEAASLGINVQRHLRNLVTKFSFSATKIANVDKSNPTNPNKMKPKKGDTSLTLPCKLPTTSTFNKISTHTNQQNPEILGTNTSPQQETFIAKHQKSSTLTPFEKDLNLSQNNEHDSLNCH